MLKILSVLFTAVLLISSFTSTTFAEHPSEHPAGEHSEMTVGMIADAIDDHVRMESKKHGGYFIVSDDETGKTLSLNLEKIHRERLSAVEDGLYFACVDFVEKGGKTYDIDFFLKDSGGRLKVTDTMVHKEDGNPRYNWEKKGDYWTRVAAE